jgi:hypothetical protein
VSCLLCYGLHILRIEGELLWHLRWDAPTAAARQADSAVLVSLSCCCLQTPEFSNLQELQRHLRREYGKLVALLQAYALIAAGVRITCSNQVPPLCQFEGSEYSSELKFKAELTGVLTACTARRRLKPRDLSPSLHCRCRA